MISGIQFLRDMNGNRYCTCHIPKRHIQSPAPAITLNCGSAIYFTSAELGPGAVFYIRSWGSICLRTGKHLILTAVRLLLLRVVKFELMSFGLGRFGEAARG